MSVLAYGGQVTAIGLTIVFTGLLIIILAICLLGVIFKFVNNKAAAKKAAPKAEAAPAPTPAPAPVEEPVAAEDDMVTDPEIIAVIAAAIAAYDSNRNLVVRSVRRASGWKKAARDEAVCRF